MEQTRALNALEPFVALSKSANSPRAAADLITQATSAPNTYVFAELLQTPNIQNLDSPSAASHRGYYTLLEIFAWGTYADYKANKSNLPPLSDTQHQKLLLISLLPLAHSHKTLTYAALLSALDLSTTHELEQLITTAIYAGLLNATLDPAHSLINVTSVAPLRDLAPGSVPKLQKTLQEWEARCEDAVKELEDRIKAVRQGAVQREKERRKKERGMEALLEATNKGGHGEQGQQPPSKRAQEEDLMDVDDVGVENLGRPARGAKRGAGAGLPSLQNLGRRFG